MESLVSLWRGSLSLAISCFKFFVCRFSRQVYSVWSGTFDFTESGRFSCEVSSSGGTGFVLYFSLERVVGLLYLRGLLTFERKGFEAGYFCNFDHIIIYILFRVHKEWVFVFPSQNIAVFRFVANAWLFKMDTVSYVFAFLLSPQNKIHMIVHILGACAMDCAYELWRTSDSISKLNGNAAPSA